ncbi:hypothetical protein BP6252_08377 [Coleophoma cylindrospora]|uniref:Uncharacterized protein n=1 Tax=Coleophoma cylindrospora TaxID=1849047 RepID=A0A3D8R5T1_9HELO|nr:hypothetical protein BP6252_08377 [Coleophoma cylindrospora]
MIYSETSTDPEAVTSSLVSPIAVPTHGAGGTFSVLAKVHISAAPLAVLNAVRDTSTWKTWNTFCPGCTFGPAKKASKAAATHQDLPLGKENWLEPGSACQITYSMVGDASKSSGQQGIEVTVLRPLTREVDGKDGFTIAWVSTGRKHWQLHSERIMEFVDDGEGGCLYACWETFGGLLGTAVKSVVGGQLRDRFGDYAKDVKGFVESKGNGS